MEKFKNTASPEALSKDVHERVGLNMRQAREDVIMRRSEFERLGKKEGLKKLAEECLSSERSLARYETGETSPDVYTLAVYSKKSQLPVGYFFKGTKMSLPGILDYEQAWHHAGKAMNANDLAGIIMGAYKSMTLKEKELLAKIAVSIASVENENN